MNPFDQLMDIGRAAQDEDFLAHLQRVKAALEAGQGKAAIRGVQGAWARARKSGFADKVHPLLSPILQHATKMDDRDFAKKATVRIASYLFRDAGKKEDGGKYAHINFTPPASVAKAADRGLKLRDKFNRGGTAVGIARARDLSNRKDMSPSTIKRMVSFFARHAGNKKPGWSKPSDPTNGYIAHLLWGGDAGKSWANKVKRQMVAADKKAKKSKKKASTRARLASVQRKLSLLARLEDSLLLQSKLRNYE